MQENFYMTHANFFMITAREFPDDIAISMRESLHAMPQENFFMTLYEFVII